MNEEEGGDVMWTLLWLLIMAVVIVVLWALKKRLDRVEDDTSYLFEGARSTSYGQKFFDILRGRRSD